MSSPLRVPSAISSGGPQLQHFSIETLIAGILALLLAVPSGLSVSLSMGSVIALILTPVTLPVLWRNKGGRWLLIALLGLIPSGWLVAQISLLQDPGRSLNIGIFLYEAAMPVGLLVSLVGAYWCITQLGLQRFLLLTFAGLLAVAPTLPLFERNAWKYALAVPASILVILLLARNRFLLGLVITPLLVTISIASDFRSWILFLALATVLSVYRPTRSEKISSSRIASLGLLTIASSVIVGWLVVGAATSGALGDYLQQRTNQQLEDSNGNLLLGGRPEWGAAFALWRKTPLGMGLGVAPSSDDYWLAIRSMPLGSKAAENSVVASYFRQGQVNFHSTFWTFWGVYGVAGVLFAVLALIYFARGAMVATQEIRSVALRASALLIMLGSTWDVLFSPTAVTQLAIALATALSIRGDPRMAPIRVKEHERIPADQRHHHHAK